MHSQTQRLVSPITTFKTGSNLLTKSLFSGTSSGGAYPSSFSLLNYVSKRPISRWLGGPKNTSLAHYKFSKHGKEFPHIKNGPKYTAGTKRTETENLNLKNLPLDELSGAEKYALEAEDHAFGNDPNDVTHHIPSQNKTLKHNTTTNKLSVTKNGELISYYDVGHKPNIPAWWKKQTAKK